MGGHRIGYIRVSTVDQNTDRQLDGVELDKLFEDKVSGSTIKRPGLEACLEYLREGDTLVVHSIGRLARNLADLEKLVAGLTNKGVTVSFVKENLIFSSDSTSAMNKLMFQLLRAVAEFERSMIRERQREGIEKAKKEGKHLGRSASLTKAQVEEIKARVAAGEAKASLAKEHGVSRPTLYAALK
nr:recombinase family protein [uncultured Desulfobulbus sp.]